MKTKLIPVLSAVLMVLPALGEEAKQPPTPQTVIIERFEAKDAKVSDVIEALTMMAEKSTNNAWKPNITISGDGVGDKTVSMNLTKAPLSDAFALIGRIPEVSVVYAKDAVTIAAKKAPVQ